MKTVSRVLVVGGLLGAGATLTWLGGIWLYAEWERRHGLRQSQRRYLFDTIDA